MSFNPLARAAMLARENADAVQADPRLADVAESDYARAAEMRRLQLLAERTRRVEEAQRQADELARRAAAFDEAVTAHEATEQAERARIVKVRKTLEASRKAMCAAVVAAHEAVSVAQKRADELNEQRAEVARELLAAGLVARYEDGDAAVDFTVGATRDGRVVVDGRWWLPVDPDAVALRSVYGAARARSGDHHGLGGELRYDPRVRRLEDQSAGVLAGAPLPAAFVPARPEWLDEVRAGQRAAMAGAPVVMSADTRESLERQRAAEEQRDRHRSEQARRDYAEKRTELVAERGEPYVAELEERLFVGGRPFGDEVAV